MDMFPNCLLELLASLLVIGSDESIKGFVQTLKVCGYTYTYMICKLPD